MANLYSQNNRNPPIPEGYKYVCGKVHNGRVIERCSDGSQFVWIPVGRLKPNGLIGKVFIDGEKFSDKFGRRSYLNEVFSEGDWFHERLTDTLMLQWESISKYGGFYISRYNISKSLAGEPQSVKGAMPWVKVTCEEAKEIASIFEDRKMLKSHLTFGAEYDSILEWFIESKARTYDEIAKDSTEWGNYWETNNSPKKVVETGSNEKWCTNNIYDFAGNVNEWTQEQKGMTYCVSRGGDYFSSGKKEPVALRNWKKPDDFNYHIGFRIALYIN